jgi:hypothetical protein
MIASAVVYTLTAPPWQIATALALLALPAAVMWARKRVTG